MRNLKELYHPIIYWHDFKMKIFIEGIMVGILSGSVVVAFRYVLEKAETWRKVLYPFLKTQGLIAIILWFGVLLSLAFFLSYLGKKEPMAGGSGIPQVKGELIGFINMNWLKVLFIKFIGGTLAIGAGLSLGREGPSVQLGAVTAKGLSRFFNRLRIEEKYLMTSGASAGLAAAFNAPLAGVIFSLEELHKNFSPAVLMSAMSASLTADFISQNVFGQRPVFNVPHLLILPLNQYGYLIGLGIVTGILGVVFNQSLLKSLNIYDRIKLPQTLKLASPLFTAGVLGFILPQVLGGGNALVDSLGYGNYGIKILLILWLGKFLFTMISFGTGVPGGIFLPLLVIGAITGDVYGHLLTYFFNFNPQYVQNMTIFAMAAYFTAIVKAPVTGSILITEMTGSFEHLLALVTVSMTAYLISDLLKSAPIYDSLLDRMLKKQTARQEVQAESLNVITEVSVVLGSELEGKCVKDILWPENCLIVSIKRGEKELIPKGRTKVLAGDFIYILTDENQVVQIKSQLIKMAHNTIPTTK